MTFLLELARALAARMQVTVLTPGFPGSRREEKLSGVTVKRFTYFLPRRTQRVVYPDGMPDQLRRSRLARVQAPFFMLSFLLAALRESRCVDLVLCNWALTGVIARLAGSVSKIPYVVVVRGTDMQIMEGSGWLARLFLETLKKARAVCVVASDFIEPLRSRGVARVHFTPNGVDLGKFSPPTTRPRPRTGARPAVVYVGSLIERKGVDYLIRALSGLNVKLTIVGDGGLRAELEQLARQQGVEVEFTGRLSSEQVPERLAAADCFVLPSLYEGRPNVLIEALAAGKACVATNIAGTRELIEDGVSGLLVPPADVDALKQAILKILENESTRASLEAHAVAHLRRNVPDWDRCAQSYERVFQEVLSG